MADKLTVSDIEDKIQERMEYLERNGSIIRLAELAELQEWLLCGGEYKSSAYVNLINPNGESI